MSDERVGPSRPVYDSLATVYDRWLSGDEAADLCLEFYVEELSGERGRVLELGCGTGRIALALASSGIDVVGLDISMAMLGRAAIARNGSSPPNDLVHLICGAFERLPFRSSAFSAVALPMRTVGHLTEARNLQATFTEVSRVLSPGGRFILDHYNLDRAWAEQHDGANRLMYAGPGDRGDRSALLIWDRYQYDFERRKLHCTVRIEEVEQGPVLRMGSSVHFDFRWFEPEELFQLAAHAGLVVESCWGDFRRAPSACISENIVLVLRKP